jgi:ElaB/YqjD/DUF883 family membrane-anchored ribosome-binding protein
MAASREADLATLQADIQQLRANFAKMTGDMRNMAANRYSQASGKIWGEVRRQAQQVSQEIEERPFISALAAFATGLLLGVLLNARRG